MLSTNLPLMNRSIYHPAIECSCGLHTWPTLLQSVCKIILHPFLKALLICIYFGLHHEKPCFWLMQKLKVQISCIVTMQLISVFVFTT